MNGDVVEEEEPVAHRDIVVGDVVEVGVSGVAAVRRVSRGGTFKRFEALLEHVVRHNGQNAPVERRAADEPDDFRVLRLERRLFRVDNVRYGIPASVDLRVVDRLNVPAAERLTVGSLGGEGENVVEVADRIVGVVVGRVGRVVVVRLVAFGIERDIGRGERHAAVAGDDAVKRPAHSFDVAEVPFVHARISGRRGRNGERFQVGGETVLGVSQGVVHLHRAHRLVHGAPDAAEDLRDGVHEHERERNGRHNLEQGIPEASPRRGVPAAVACAVVHGVLAPSPNLRVRLPV